VRFGAEEYDINNLNKKYAHLTNNSIVKHSTDFGKIIKGCMWEEKQLAEYLTVSYSFFNLILDSYLLTIFRIKQVKISSTGGSNNR